MDGLAAADLKGIIAPLNFTQPMAEKPYSYNYEPPPGVPLFVKLVEQGRIVYREPFPEQAARADRTWGRYRRWELSATLRGWQERFGAMRQQEMAAARRRLG